MQRLAEEKFAQAGFDVILASADIYPLPEELHFLENFGHLLPPPYGVKNSTNFVNISSRNKFD